jgi:hypothetical protein
MIWAWMQGLWVWLWGFFFGQDDYERGWQDAMSQEHPPEPSAEL